MMSQPIHDSDEKYEDVEIAEQSPLLRWLDNFWYHNKWTVIIVAFFAMVLIVCLTQMFSDPVYDIYITYSGPYGFGMTDAEAMYQDLSDALPSDLNGDGARYAGFIRYQIYSEEEIKEEWEQVEQARKEAEARGEDPSEIQSSINTAYNSTQFSQFRSSLMTGQCYIYLCSPFVFEEMKASNRVCKISDITDTPPAHLNDEYSVLLKDTAMYQQSEMLQKLPENTVICLLTEIPQLFSQNEDHVYPDAKDTFLSLIQ